RIDTSPSTMSKASFIVTISPLRIRREALDVAAFRLGPLHRQLFGVAAGDLAVLDGDELRKNADRDLLRRDGADVEADGRVDSFELLRGRPVGDELIVNARHLRAASNQAEVAELAWGKSTQRFEIVRMTTRDDDGIRVRRQTGAGNPRGNVFD